MPAVPSNRFLIVLLGSLTAVSPFSIDMYLPAFGLIATDFAVSPGRVSLSLSSYFVALAMGQLLYGPLMDRFGRKRPVIVGLSLYLLACIGCGLAPNVQVLVAFRFVQAIGASSAQVGAMTMVRDFFPPDQRARAYSMMMLILGVAPLVAPTVGSVVATALGWRWVFACLAVIVSGILASTVAFLPESRVPDRNFRLGVLPVLRTYAGILKNRQFTTYGLAGALTFAGLFTYVTGSPRIFMESLGVTARQYGLIFAVLAAGYIIGAQLNVVLLRKHTSARIFRGTLTFLPFVAGAFFWGAWNQVYGVSGTMAVLFTHLALIGMTNPNSAALALAPFATNAGSAASMLGFTQMSIGSLASASLGFMDVAGSLPVASVFVTTTVLARLVLALGRRYVSGS